MRGERRREFIKRQRTVPRIVVILAKERFFQIVEMFVITRGAVEDVGCQVKVLDDVVKFSVSCPGLQDGVAASQNCEFVRCALDNGVRYGAAG